MCTVTRTRVVPFARTPYWAFLAFGAFWGTWGASIPRLRELSRVSDAELGTALLFVGVGALPAMLLAGRALDRRGLWLAGPLLLALGASGVVVALTAGGGMAALCTGMMIVGATSGAADVAINALAGRAEQVSGRPIITRSHATFSAVVVGAIVGAGALAGMRAPLIVPFALTALVTAIACAVIVLSVRQCCSASDSRSDEAEGTDAPVLGLPLSLVAGLGALGALAFAAENAHQSWSALFLEEELSAAVGMSAFGPAVFAGTVAITRFAIARIPSRHARAVLLMGAATATIGAVALAFAPTIGWALAALALAAAGTAVLFPTILGMVSRGVQEGRRAKATSIVTAIAYLGFLAGPAYVGLVADAVELRGAMTAVALLTSTMIVLIPALLRQRRYADAAPLHPPARITHPE